MALSVAFTRAGENSARPELSAEWNDPKAFSIPALPLARALQLFSETTGIEVVADAKITPAIVSEPVYGTMMPADALQRILRTSRLGAWTYGGATAIVAAPDKDTPPPKDIPAENFFAVVQAAVIAALCGNEKTRPGHYRLAIALFLDADGAVTKAIPLDSTGDRELDARLSEAVKHVKVAAKLPDNLLQPIAIVISPASDARSGCAPGSRASIPPAVASEGTR